MGKRNVRAKAKSAVGALKQKTQELQAQINKTTRQDKMLHKTLKPKQTITKKEKSENKHNKLLKRFVEVKKDIKEEHERKKREKTKVVGDLQPLRDALPALDDIYKQVKSGEAEETAPDEVPKKLSVKKKLRKGREERADKIKEYLKLITDKKFRENAREIVANHVRNKYQTIEQEVE